MIYLKRRKPPRSGIRDNDGPIRCPSHLKWVRGMVCAAFGKVEGHWCLPLSRCEAHHVRENGNAGAGMKPSDSETVPLCSGHHKELHDKGRITFEKKYSVDLDVIAKELWARSPHRIRYEQQRRSAAE